VLDVVTGGAGFIGSHRVRALLRNGRDVHVVDNLSTGTLENLAGLQTRFGAAFQFVELDVRDKERLKRALDGAEVVYHQAAVPSVQRSIENPVRSNDVNVGGTLNVLAAASELGVRKVVFASSSSVYGDAESLPKVESMNARPLSPYAVSKLADELYGRIYSSIHRFPTVGLRYFNVFGPRQNLASQYAAVIPKFVARMLTGKPPVIYGDGEQSRDFTFVQNVVSANLMAAGSDATGVSVNIGSGERHTLNELVRLLNDILGTDFDPVYEEPRLGDVRHSLAGLEAASSEIGYAPEIGFRDGLERTVAWLKRDSRWPVSVQPEAEAYS
jgi:nucleoside-diphosphate-sugar epimerase